ncbi:hypothetical protein B0H10DRAFT_1993890 [Mycena sp. CBHHK59/15]|nr:hypothetical protein B0H10DRAFT_1993890 [Mycena sp. CBHHK59/15]
MASVIWIDSDAEADDLVEFVEPPAPCKPTELLAGPSTIANTQLRHQKQNASTPHKKRQRTSSSDSEIEILDTPKAKIHKSIKTKPLSVDEDRIANEDHAVALELQRKWDEEDALAQKLAAETEEKSLRLIAHLQKMDQSMAEKRRQLAQSKDVPDDGIVFKVVIDADGKTLEGDEDPDNATHLDLVKRDFEKTLASGVKLKTVTWFVNAKLEARFEAAKDLLNSLAIDTTERNLFHGTAAANIRPILENGFLMPGVSPGARVVNGQTEGRGIYLATESTTSCGYAWGATKMFMCRVITGRSTLRVSQAIPRPLGQNGFESWSGPGFFVLKYAELVVPRYVVEFEYAMAQNNPYNALGINYEFPINNALQMINHRQSLAGPPGQPLALGALGLPFAMPPGAVVPPFTMPPVAALPPFGAAALAVAPPPARKKRAAANPRPPSKRAVKGKGKAKQIDETEE